MSALKRAGEPVPRLFLCLATHNLASPIICFAIFSRSFRPCLPVYLPSFGSSKNGESDMLAQLFIITDGKQIYWKFPD